MIQHVYGDIIDVQAELLINAANGRGWMGGLKGRFTLLKGVAESIHFADPSIEKNAKHTAKKDRVQLGDVYLTGAGKLAFSKGILHAVTMNKPGQRSDLETIETCLNNIMKYCDENSINTVAIPLLGTGTGIERRCNKSI